MSKPNEPDYMMEEMLEQAAVWERIERAAPALLADLSRAGFDRSSPRTRIVFTGSGDSFCASELGAWACRSGGLAAEAVCPLELGRYRRDLLGADTTLVAISASGRTVRVLEAAAIGKACGARVVAVTDAPSGPLARLGDVTALLGASPPDALDSTDYTDDAAAVYVGYHHDVPQTKTFTASVAWGVALAGLSLGSAAPVLRRVVGSDAALHTEVAAALADASRVVFVGSGPGFAIARYGAYKLHEFTRGALLQEAEEFCHTHYFSCGPGTLVVFLVHDEHSAARAAEIIPVLESDLGARAAVIAAGEAPTATGGVVRTGEAVDPTAGWVGLIGGVQRVTHAMAHRIGLSTSTFRGGVEVERYVAGSQKTIRESAVVPPARFGL